MVNKEQSTLKITIGVGAIIIIFLGTIFLFILSNTWKNSQIDSAKLDYYKNQLQTICKLSNAYRQMVIIQNESVERDIAPELDCDYISLEAMK